MYAALRRLPLSRQQSIFKEKMLYLQSRGFAIQRGVEQKPGSAKKHLDTREFKQQQEALNRLIQESEEMAQRFQKTIDELEQREEELKKSIEEHERQAEEAEKILQEEFSLPKATVFNYQSILQKASALIAEQKKALAVKHITQTRMENLQREAEALRQKQTRLEGEYAAHRKQSHEEKESLGSQLEKADAIMAGFLEFLRLPEIRPLHLDFLNRKRAELLQRQSERQEAEARQEAREQHVQQEREAVPQRRRSRMR